MWYTDHARVVTGSANCIPHFDVDHLPTPEARYDAQVEALATSISQRLLPSCLAMSRSELKELATGMAVIELKYLHTRWRSRPASDLR